MQTVLEETNSMEDVQQFINTHPYSSEYVINADALQADGATVEAFKAYLNKKLLHDGVDKIEDGNRVVYGMHTSISQVAAEGLGFAASDIDFQPWFHRYFSQVTSYEPGSLPLDVQTYLVDCKTQGWDTTSDADNFFPKN